MTDSDGAANANQGTAEISRIGDGSKQAFKNGSNMGELRAIKEGYYKLDSDGAANANHSAGTVEIMRTDDGHLVVASDARHGSNVAELRAIKEGSYSGCIVEELPTMRLDVVSGENEKWSGKITLDLSRKVEKGIISGEIRRVENMAASIKFQNRLEILKNERAQGSVKYPASFIVQDIVSRVQGNMESLPSDVLQEIVSRVPAESVLECKLVCKKWGTLVRETNFANMHLSHQLHLLHGVDDGNDNQDAKVESCLFFACEIDHPNDCKVLLFHGGQVSGGIGIDEKYIYNYNQNLKRIYHPPLHKEPLYKHLVGSCNGLVCSLQLHNTILDPIYICNPLTREYAYLPELVVKKEDVLDPERIEGGEVKMCYFTACGFGYVRSTNEYKVVRIHYIDYKGGIVEVYTLGSGFGWRAIGRVPYKLNTWGGGVGTYANDAIFWTAGDKVVAFDLAKEEFRLLSAPLRMENHWRKIICGLVALGRHLCVYMDDKFHVEIWSLMKTNDSEETWCKEFDVDYKAIEGSYMRKMRPILLTKKGEIILLYAESVLYCYDAKTTVLKMISNEASTNYLGTVDAIAHVNTFVSLEAMGENSKRYMFRQRRVRTPWDDVIDELDRVALGEEIDTTYFRLK